MIKGIGNDIVEIERIKKAVSKESFIKRWFSDEEIRLFNEKKVVQTIAANFAAKEAFVKALGTGFSSNVPPEDISVLRDEKGAPYILLKNSAKIMAENIGVSKIHISLSHSKEYAFAVIICEGDD
jgi:holo-[acyl-carrier protein] synthase